MRRVAAKSRRRPVEREQGKPSVVVAAFSGMTGMFVRLEQGQGSLKRVIVLHSGYDPGPSRSRSRQQFPPETPPRGRGNSTNLGCRGPSNVRVAARCLAQMS